MLGYTARTFSVYGDESPMMNEAKDQMRQTVGERSENRSYAENSEMAQQHL